MRCPWCRGVSEVFEVSKVLGRDLAGSDTCKIRELQLSPESCDNCNITKKHVWGDLLVGIPIFIEI